MPTRTCAHCGREGIIGGALITRDGVTPLCHENDCHSTSPMTKPYDCYRLVTVYKERVGERLNDDHLLGERVVSELSPFEYLAQAIRDKTDGVRP